MWLTLFIIHLVILIFILIILYWMLRKKMHKVERKELKSPFMIKLDKIKKRLEKLKYSEE